MMESQQYSKYPTKKPICVTNPYNHKRKLYEALGFLVPDDNLLYEIANKAEELYDEEHGIGFTGPLYPEKGLGFPYPVEVALAKLLAVLENITSDNKPPLNGPIITTDVVWTTGEEIVNKPKTPEEAVYWWLKNRGREIYNIAGNATWEGNFVTLTAIFLMPGKVNPKLPMDRLRTLLYSNLDVNTSGGLNLFRALEEGIISHNGEIRWIRAQWPPFSIEDLLSNQPLPIDPSNPSAVDHGELSLTSENRLSIMGLLFGVEPR